IQSYFQSLLDTYRIDLSRIFSVPDLPEEISLQARLAAGQTGFEAGVDVQAVKKILGLTLPGMTLLPRYSGRIQTHALAGMAVTFITRFFRSLFDRHPSVSLSFEFDAAARKIKKQTLQGMPSQIDRFHARLKHQYFTPLIQAVTRDVMEKIHDRFAMYETLDTDMTGSGAFDETKKQQHREEITGIVTRLQQIRQNIVQLKEADVHQYPV
ncbi:MAG: hypothetical protein ACQEQ5_11205, partial [Thermodesulfobacteriota bacterium]